MRLAIAALFASALSGEALFSVPFDVVVPRAPVAFRGNGAFHLVYGLHLTNFEDTPRLIPDIQVLGPGESTLRRQGAKRIRHIGYPDRRDTTTVAPGARAMVYMWVTINDAPPPWIEHRIGGVTTARVPVRTDVIAIGPPLRGEWRALNGSAPAFDNHHTSSIAVVGGRALMAQRFAIDFVRFIDGRPFRGEGTQNTDHYALGNPVIAVADARVARSIDGLPDHTPGAELPEPTRDTIAGNTVVLELGNGLFAHYAHLQKGSVRVKAGDVVKAGDLLGLVGSSGNSSGPHLHFHICDSPFILGGEGVPFHIGKDMPLDGAAVTFPER